MIVYILRRLAAGVAMLFVIASAAFTLLYLGGGDIARRLLGETAGEDQVALRAAELGLDRPLAVQYGDWLADALHGDLGRSWFTGETVATGIATRMAVTVTIVTIAMIVAAIVSVMLGVLAALRGGWVDRVVQVVATVGYAVPAFLIALALVIVFAINLGWFRATGFIPITQSFGGWVMSITLPVTALAIGTIAVVTQQMRGTVLDVLELDYVRTLRSRGLSYRSVVLTHVLRNASGPPLAVLTVQFVGLLGGAVVIEQVFALPGLGQLAVQATTQGDIPLVMGLVLVTAAMVVVVNLVMDIAHAALNPKVRLS